MDLLGGHGGKEIPGIVQPELYVFLVKLFSWQQCLPLSQLKGQSVCVV